MKKKTELEKVVYIPYYPLPESLTGYGGATCDFCYTHIAELPKVGSDRQGQWFACQSCADEQKANKQLELYGIS